MSPLRSDASDRLWRVRANPSQRVVVAEIDSTSPGTVDRQGLPSPGYRFHFRIDPEPTKRTLRLEEDGEIVGALIRNAGRPVFFREIVAELSKSSNFASLRSDSQEKRAQAALRALKREGLAKPDRRGSHAGWVWIT